MKHPIYEHLDLLARVKKFKPDLNDEFLDNLNSHMNIMSDWKLTERINNTTLPFEDDNMSPATEYHKQSLKDVYENVKKRAKKTTLLEAIESIFTETQSNKLRLIQLEDSDVKKDARIEILEEDKRAVYVQNIFADLLAPIKRVGYCKYGKKFDLDLLGTRDHPDHDAAKNTASDYLQYLQTKHKFPTGIHLNQFIGILLDKEQRNSQSHSGTTGSSIDQYIQNNEVQLTEQEKNLKDCLLNFNSGFYIDNKHVTGKGHYEMERLENHFAKK